MITNGIVIDVPAALATLISKEEEPISRGGRHYSSICHVPVG